jgi:hypothetical protein
MFVSKEKEFIECWRKVHSEKLPASYPMGTSDSFPVGKAAGAWSLPLTSIECWDQRMSGTVPSLPQYAFIAWCSVKKEHKVNFTFTFYM